MFNNNYTHLVRAGLLGAKFGAVVMTAKRIDTEQWAAAVTDQDVSKALRWTSAGRFGMTETRIKFSNLTDIVYK